jgi:uncharacterized LabA/DUF88 family protein
VLQSPTFHDWIDTRAGMNLRAAAPVDELNPALTVSDGKLMIPDRSTPGSKLALTDSAEPAEPRGFSFLRHNSLTLTAVLVDAGFFVKRAARIYGPQMPEAAANQLHRIALDHLKDDRGHRIARLYRIFVYDAPPADWKGHTPISRQSVDYGRSDLAEWRRALHQHLRRLRKVALRLGHIPTTQVRWQLNTDALKALVNGRREWTSIGDGDFRLDLRQKGVDMRIGLDIASLAYKRQINQLVLILRRFGFCARSEAGAS